MRRKKKSAKLKAKVEQRRPDSAVRPTPERHERGVWTNPKGMGKHDLPVVDLTSDIVGYLLHKRQITSSQEQSARVFQAARLAYMAELPEVSGYKSCISGDVPGFDDGDGDAQVIERYRDIERAVGRQGRIELLLVCEENQRPRRMDVLRLALDAIGGM